MTKRLFYKLQPYSGVAAIVILWSFIVTAMFRAGLGLFDDRPLSYLGINVQSRLLFSSSLLISSFLFVVFGYYVKRKFRVKNKFMTYLIAGQAAQAVAAIFPYGLSNVSGHIHTIAAFTLAFSLPLLIREFALSQTTSPYHPLYIKLLRLEQVAFVVGIGLFIITKGYAPLDQALPTIGFHLWVIVLTYLAVTSKSETKLSL